MRVLAVFVLVIIVRVSDVYSTRMIRLCIASVDLLKLSSQCVMCNRREFPLTAIDCTGITKMNDLISNPLSVKEASCLIFNCRRVSISLWLPVLMSKFTNWHQRNLNQQQVPNIEPEPYHGSVSHAARVNYASAASGTRSYGMMPPRTAQSFSMYDNYPPPPMPQYTDYLNPMQHEASFESPSALPSAGDLINSHVSPARQQQSLPYALVPTSYSSPFGEYSLDLNKIYSQKATHCLNAATMTSTSFLHPITGLRKYKAALVPLF